MYVELSIKSYSRLISTNVTIDIECAPDATLWFIILQKITNVKKSLHSDKKISAFLLCQTSPKCVKIIVFGVGVCLILMPIGNRMMFERSQELSTLLDPVHTEQKSHFN